MVELSYHYQHPQQQQQQQISCFEEKFIVFGIEVFNVVN